MTSLGGAVGSPGNVWWASGMVPRTGNYISWVQFQLRSIYFRDDADDDRVSLLRATLNQNGQEVRCLDAPSFR